MRIAIRTRNVSFAADDEDAIVAETLELFFSLPFYIYIFFVGAFLFAYAYYKKKIWNQAVLFTEIDDITPLKLSFDIRFIGAIFGIKWKLRADMLFILERDSRYFILERDSRYFEILIAHRSHFLINLNRSYFFYIYQKLF